MARLTTLDGFPVVGLGLGARRDRDPDSVQPAAARGVRLFFFYGPESRNFMGAVAGVAASDRGGVLIATGSESRGAAHLRRVLRRCLEGLGTDYLDAFFAEYVRPDEDPAAIFGPGETLDELVRWKQQGLIRYVGASAHDRTVSKRLAEDPRLDVLMQRYNMAHRKAARHVFPACERAGVAVVAFTATRWGSLTQGHPDWPEPPPTAADCYRFCLAHPAIDVTLTAPANRLELEENLAALAAPPMSDAERRHWCAYGDLVYGDGTDGFETDWP